MDQGRGVGKDGRVAEEPGFDIFQIVTIRSVKTRIVHKERGHVRTMAIVDESLRQLLVRSGSRDASAIDRNRAAFLGNNVADIRLIAHHEGHVAVVSLGDPGITGSEVLLEIGAVVPFHQRFLPQKQIARLPDFIGVCGIERIAKLLEGHAEDFARVVEQKDVAGVTRIE